MALRTPTLATDRLRLRPVAATDAVDLFALQSDASVLRYWDSPPWTDRAQADRFVARSAEMAAAGSGVRLVVEDAATARFLGWCSLAAVNPDFRSASLGYCLTRAAWGRGYATEAGRAMVGWAFATLDLNRLQAEVDTRNPASARVLGKLGFRREGTLREDCIVAGVVSDTWVFGLLAREWQPSAGAGGPGPGSGPDREGGTAVGS